MLEIIQLSSILGVVPLLKIESEILTSSFLSTPRKEGSICLVNSDSYFPYLIVERMWGFSSDFFKCYLDGVPLF